MAGSDGIFDEMHGFGDEVRPPYAGYSGWFDRTTPSALLKKSRDAQAVFRRTGITFNVYGETEADERLIPFDGVEKLRVKVAEF